MKAISLLSSGIDSPVATYVLSSFMDEITLAHIDTRPFTDDSENEKFSLIANYLSNICSCKINICIIPHGETIKKYKEGKLPSRFICVFCKRMMVRYAEMYAKHHCFDYIIMGDSLGQVASQTLANIAVVDQAITIPILRPLIGYDKEEIINIAKKIGTFDLSIQKTLGCLAVPKKPATKANNQQLSEIEENLQVHNLIGNALNNIEHI
jgi:thiamine biosynthesis protein ThiI